MWSRAPQASDDDKTGLAKRVMTLVLPCSHVGIKRARTPRMKLNRMRRFPSRVALRHEDGLGRSTGSARPAGWFDWRCFLSTCFLAAVPTERCQMPMVGSPAMRRLRLKALRRRDMPHLLALEGNQNATRALLP